MKSPRHTWTTAEQNLLRRLYPTTPTADLAGRLGLTAGQVYRKASALGLHKSAAHIAALKVKLRAAMNDPAHPGRLHQFKPGQAPYNKGLRRPGWAPGRMRETQFAKGRRPHTWRPIGTLRTSKEGYLQVKLTDTGYTPRDYVAVHLLVWELHRGAVPPKHHVSFIDGNRERIAIDNLELVSFAAMMKRNTVHNLPKPLAELVLLRGALKRKINRIERNHHERDHC